MENSPVLNLDISPNSKKISKRKSKTYKKPEQKIIINDLIKALAIHCERKDQPEGSKHLSKDDLADIQNKDLASYNLCLKKVLRKHGYGLGLTVGKLTQWRKKVKGWIENYDKPDGRGGKLVVKNREKAFKKRVLQIVSRLTLRRYELIQKEIIEAAKEVSLKAYSKPGKEPFSKTWWNKWVNEDLDVKKKWNAIPLERVLEKQFKQIDFSMLGNDEISAQTNGYFIQELINSGNINLYYQDSNQNVTHEVTQEIEF